MVVLLLAVAAVLVVGIAFVFVGDAVGKTEAMPDQIVIDATEAIEFCAEALPSSITAELSYDELRRLQRLHLEWVQAYHWSPSSQDATPIVFEQYDPLPYVLERAAVVGLITDEETAAAVIEAHTQYLVVSGALHIDNPEEVTADLAEAALLDSPDLPELEGPEREGAETEHTELEGTSDE